MKSNDNKYLHCRSFNTQLSVKNVSDNKSIIKSRPNTSCQKTYHSDQKSFELVNLHQYYDVMENQKKISQLQVEVRKSSQLKKMVDDATIFDKLSSNKSLLNVDQPFYHPKCQSKRLNDYVHLFSLKQKEDLFGATRQPLQNKFQQIENDLDANLDRIKKDFKNLKPQQNLQRSIESETKSSKQYTLRKCSCKCNKQQQCQDVDTLYRRRSSQSFQTTTYRDYNKLSVNASTQTTSDRDYKKKYKQMVEKVRTNELVYLELKKENMKLSSDMLCLREGYQTLQKTNYKLKYNLQELNESQHLFKDQSMQEIERIKKQDHEYQRQQKDKHEAIKKENINLKEQLSQFSLVDKQIQEIENLYLNTLNVLQEQVKTSKSLITHIKSSTHNVINVSECFRENTEIPLQTLVQHRQQGNLELEDDLLDSTRTEDGEQIQAQSQKNIDTLEQIFKSMCRYLDSIAEKQIYSMGNTFNY